ncbi:2859_t:CDS:2 [Rhizophagus irregularis]|nr:2859_t:CDS:2 [Rhizophagus irregularis]
MTNVEYGGYENIKIIEIDRCSGCGQKFADEILSYFICKFEHSDSQVETKIKIKEAFSHEREEKWKLQLAELAANSCPLKKSQNMLASKKLDCLKQLTAAKDVEMKTNDYSMLYTL